MSTSRHASAARLLIVSNRLPVTIEHEGGLITLRQSSGGLATGLRRLHETGRARWVGWPGANGEIDVRDRAGLERQLAAARMVPVWLNQDEVSRYYHGIAKGVLGPLFPYLLDQMPLVINDWEAYEAANVRFAEAAAHEYREGDLVWV